jgi:K+ transporter
MTKENLLKLSWVVLIIAVILLVWDGCSKKAQLSALKEEMSKFDISTQKFTQKLNENNEKIVQQEQVILSQKDAIALNLLEIDRIRKIKSQVRIKSVIDIDSVFIPYTEIDTMYINNPCNFLEKKFSLSNEYYSFSGTTKEDGVLLDSVSFNNDMSITIANKKMGFLKKSKPIVEVVYKNPYITTTKMNNVVVEEDKKWYQKGGTWFGVGIGLGFFGGLLIK